MLTQVFLSPGWMAHRQRVARVIRRLLIVLWHTLALGFHLRPLVHSQLPPGALRGELRPQEAQVSRQPQFGRRGRVTRRCWDEKVGPRRWSLPNSWIRSSTRQVGGPTADGTANERWRCWTQHLAFTIVIPSPSPLSPHSHFPLLLIVTLGQMTLIVYWKHCCISFAPTHPILFLD